MIQIEYGLLWQDPDDPGRCAFAIGYGVAFSGVKGQIRWRNGLNFGFVVRAIAFFRRQRNRCDLSWPHTRDPLLEPERDRMLTLDESLDITIGRGGAILGCDLKPHRHLRTVPYSHLLRLDHRRGCLDKAQKRSLPQEQGQAYRTYEEVSNGNHAVVLLSYSYGVVNPLVQPSSSIPETGSAIRYPYSS